MRIVFHVYEFQCARVNKIKHYENNKKKKETFRYLTIISTNCPSTTSD
jgi:hypothetical protein